MKFQVSGTSLSADRVPVGEALREGIADGLDLPTTADRMAASTESVLPTWRWHPTARRIPF